MAVKNKRGNRKEVLEGILPRSGRRRSDGEAVKPSTMRGGL